MNPNMNPQGFQPNGPFDEYHSFGPNSSSWQDTPARFRGQGHYQGPYSTANPRMRQHGDFSQRGRYPYSKRGGQHRPYNRERNSDQQHQSQDNNSQQTTTINSSNRNFFRMNMLEDPWFHMKPKKVPSDGKFLVFDSEEH